MIKWCRLAFFGSLKQLLALCPFLPQLWHFPLNFPPLPLTWSTRRWNMRTRGCDICQKWLTRLKLTACRARTKESQKNLSLVHECQLAVPPLSKSSYAYNMENLLLCVMQPAVDDRYLQVWRASGPNFMVWIVQKKIVRRTHPRRKLPKS